MSQQEVAANSCEIK